MAPILYHVNWQIRNIHRPGVVYTRLLESLKSSMTKKSAIEKWVNRPTYAYLLAAGSVLLCVILSFHLAQFQSYHLVAFVLLLLVSFLSTFLSTGPILLASTLSAITWNFFFIPPS